MAKADDTTSTVDWIWLRDALALAVAALGTLDLAKERLIKWLAAGKLPWSCMSWKGLDAEGIAKAKQQLREAGIFYIVLPSAAYCEGDPKFWSVRPQIDWEDNTAREPVISGAKAQGVKVSLTHLQALVPKEPLKREEVRGAGAWIAAEVERMKKAQEIPSDIGITDLSHELERRMLKAAASDKSLRPIKWRSIKNRLPEWGLWPVTSIK